MSHNRRVDRRCMALLLIGMATTPLAFGRSISKTVDCPASTAFDATSLNDAMQKDLPRGWTSKLDKSLITVRSPEMQLSPSGATGLPHGRIMQPFVMRIKIGEKLTEAEQKRRTESRVVPRRKHGGKEEWIPDFYTDTFAVKIEFPRYVPSDPKDRKKVADVYGRLRKHWKVYPESEHADAKHYASLLELGSD